MISAILWLTAMVFVAGGEYREHVNKNGYGLLDKNRAKTHCHVIGKDVESIDKDVNIKCK